MPILFLSVLLIFTTNCDLIDQVLPTLQKKVCPYVDLDGVSHNCPSDGVGVGVTKSELLTFDALTGFNTYPIIDMDLSKPSTRTGLKQSCIPHAFNTIDDFYNQFYDLNKIVSSASWTYYNGMFRQDSITQNILPMFDTLSSQPQRQSFVSNQMLYSYSTVSVDMANVKVKTEFAQIVNSYLPTTYDETQYRKFVSVFGTHVATSCDFGGMMETDLFVRDCEKIMKFAGTFQADLCADLYTYTTNPAGTARNGSDEFQKSTTIKRKRIVGGDPLLTETSQWLKRITTFPANPVGIRCTFRPIQDFVADASKKANIKTYITKYVLAEAAKRLADFQAIRAKQPIPMVVGVVSPGPGYMYSIGIPGALPNNKIFQIRLPWAYHKSGRRVLDERSETSTKQLFGMTDETADIVKQLFNATSRDDGSNHWTEDGSGTAVYSCQCKTDRKCGCWYAGEVMKDGSVGLTDIAKCCYKNFNPYMVAGPTTVNYIPSGLEQSGCIICMATFLDYYGYSYPYQNLYPGWANVYTYVGCENMVYSSGFKCQCVLP